MDKAFFEVHFVCEIDVIAYGSEIVRKIRQITMSYFLAAISSKNWFLIRDFVEVKKKIAKSQCHKM